ncbi:hypothetical protein Lser_V15G29973 [Lactuca serriola]
MDESHQELFEGYQMKTMVSTHKHFSYVYSSSLRSIMFLLEDMVLFHIEMKTKSLTYAEVKKNQKKNFPENSQESKGHAKSGKFDQVECYWLETQQESKGHAKRFLKFKKRCLQRILDV